MQVLIADDDEMIADLLREGLTEAGYEICAVARSVTEAVAGLHSFHPALAILDINLADRTPRSAAQGLLQATWPIGLLFTSGTGLFPYPAELGGAGFLAKPYCIAEVVASLAIVADIVRDGVSARARPAGFHLLREAAEMPALLRAGPVFARTRSLFPVAAC